MRKLGPAGRRFRGADDSLTREADFEASAPDTAESYFIRCPWRHRITRRVQESKELEEIFTPNSTGHMYDICHRL